MSSRTHHSSLITHHFGGMKVVVGLGNPGRQYAGTRHNVGFMVLDALAAGPAVRQVVDFYKLSPADLLVVCDDFALPLGKLRVRAKGTHGGHNGLRSIQDHLGTTEYARLRVGVGGPKDDA